MAKMTNSAVLKTQKRLSDYKFDTSNYIILESGVRRDAATGKLMVHAVSKGAKQKSK